MQAVRIQMLEATESSKTIEELFEEHHKVVLQSAFRVTGSVDDAEDVLQTVFTRLLRRKSIPNLGEGARAYLNRAAVNAALDIIRSKKGARAVPLEDIGAVPGTHPANRPDQVRSSKELARWLRDAIGRLSPKPAEMFVLRFMEGYSNQEIAELLGTSAGTIAVTLHRTRVRLQEEVSSFLGGN